MSLSLGRILVVDDEAPVREVLSEYFTSQGYTVHEASGGKDALAAIRRDRPDLVLLDVRMPGIDGVEVLRRIRELDDALAVIMVTANEDAALARETLQLGAFDYVGKPFHYVHLRRAAPAGRPDGRRAASTDPAHRRREGEPHPRRGRRAAHRSRGADACHGPRDREPPPPLRGRQDAAPSRRAGDVAGPAPRERDPAGRRGPDRPCRRHRPDGPDRDKLRGPRPAPGGPGRGPA